MDQSISELICTRISHDIIGNVGAVCNAVELLEEGDMEFIDDIRSILKVSSKVLSSRLKFFRLAFGLKNANLENSEFVIQATQDYLKTLGNSNYPIDLTMKIEHSQFLRYAMLCVMSLADTFIRGGKIEVEEVHNILVVAVFPNGPLSEEKKNLIKNIIQCSTLEPLNPQGASLFYLQTLLKDTTYQLSVADEGTFALRIK